MKDDRVELMMAQRGMAMFVYTCVVMGGRDKKAARRNRRQKYWKIRYSLRSSHSDLERPMPIPGPDWPEVWDQPE